MNSNRSLGLHRTGPGARAAASVALILVAGHAARAQQTTSSAQSPDELQEVVVTAQRRSEDIQKIPLAITAVSADAISNQGTPAVEFLPYKVP